MPPYGDIFRTGEVLLFHFSEKPGFFARIEDIQSDRKKGWWQFSFLVLSIPLQKMTWILDNDQMRGGDFTMSGEPIRIERVVAPDSFLKSVPEKDVPEKDEEKRDGGKVISMFDDE
jgi:hypothetical protein